MPVRGGVSMLVRGGVSMLVRGGASMVMKCYHGTGWVSMGSVIFRKYMPEFST